MGYRQHSKRKVHKIRTTPFRQKGAHILDLETIEFVTSGLGQLSISDNWPQARLASQTIGSMKP